MTILKQNRLAFFPNIAFCCLFICLVLASGCSQPMKIAHDEPSSSLPMSENLKRDEMVQNLVKRIEFLEKQQQKQNGTGTDSMNTSAGNSVPKISAPAPVQTTKNAPGSFEVDEDLAQRALERTLVQTGALLLPTGQAEVQPYVTYSYREYKNSQLTYSGLNPTPDTLINASLKRDDIEPGVNLLVGIPFESQLEVRLPYRFANQTITSSYSGAYAGTVEHNLSANTIENINVGLAKTLLHQSRWQPDLIGRITFDIPTGTVSTNNLPMWGGFKALGTSLTALKREDPLAFTARLGYTKTFEKDHIEPGDQFSLSLGANLAASPQTSLTLGLQQTFAQSLSLNGQKIPGTSLNSSALTVGAASTIGRNLFFSVTGGIGLTEESQKYFINVVLPIRFDLPSIS